MCSVVHERMKTFIDEVKQASSWPDITFEGILLIFELFRRGIDGCSFIEWEVVNFWNLITIDTAGTSKISYFYNHAFADENVFWLKITVHDSIDVHDHKCLDNLFENTQDLVDCEFFLFIFEVFEKITIFTVFHNDL